MTCIEVIMTVFPNATIVPPEELDLYRQQTIVDEWNAAERGPPPPFATKRQQAKFYRRRRGPT